MKRILIAGGTGFVGEHLRRYFVSLYHEVYILSTQKKLCSQSLILYWSPYEKIIDVKGIEYFDVVINLTGANIAKGLWTKSRKKELYKSRIETTLYLKELINSKIIKTDYFVQISAIGIYGNRGNIKLNEDSAVGNGFLAGLTVDWEDAIEGLKVPLSKLRLGVVFHPTEGAFPKFIMGLKYKFLIIFGTGTQYISWIDIDDLCRQIHFMIENKLSGIFNAVSPQPVQYFYLLKKYNSKFGGISIPFIIPEFLVRLLLGDFSEIFLFSQKVSSRKIQNLGFQYLSSDLSNFFKKNKKKL